MAQRRNLVLGLGKTGVSVVQWLAARGESIVVNDSRSEPPGAGQVAGMSSPLTARYGGFATDLLDEVDRVVISPGVPRQENIAREAAARGIPVIGDIELFAEDVQAPVVAVTGTNGKSTVTTLVATMIQAAGMTAHAGGNLGDPALSLLSREVPDYYVLELSSYQLESTNSLHLKAATVLNVTADHMDRYEGMGDYARAKERIFLHAESAVVNADDPFVSSMTLSGAQRTRFSLVDASADFCVADGSIFGKGKPVMPVTEVALPGLHNTANALAALALGDAIGLPADAMATALREFRGLPHRMQVVAEFGGVRFVNDSKGTNVGATVAAVAGLRESLVVVAGGDGKGQDFGPLRDAFTGRVKHLVLIGRDRASIAAAVKDVCPVEYADDMNDAVRKAARQAKPGELVLLSPACASLDMFRDYADRGEQFSAAARRLAS